MTRGLAVLVLVAECVWQNMARPAPAATVAERAVPADHAITGPKPCQLAPGPHLFIDDFLVANSRGVTRRVHPPRRIPQNPLVSSIAATGNQPGKGCSGNQVYVCYDSHAKVYKMWTVVDRQRDADVVKAIGNVVSRWTPVYRDSSDGITWGEPRIQEGIGGQYFLYDPTCAEAGERYKATNFTIGPVKRGMSTYFSADGRAWRLFERIWEPFPGDENDIWAPTFDPLSKRYYLFMKPMMRHQWTDVHGQQYSASVRQTWIATSTDFKNWTEPRPLFVPDAKDEGITQSYAASPGLRRGEHFVVFLRELRDDLKASRAPGDDAKPESYDGGIGYTLLAWTTDGENWKRDRFTDKFLAPDPDPAAWDHAHAWISAAVEVGDEVWLYYGGYKYGHKYYTDRSVGMAKMKRDRFVALEAGPEAGTLLTRPVLLRGRGLTVNAEMDGELRVRIIDAAGRSLLGFDSQDHPAIRGNGVALPVRWTKDLSSLAEQPVQIEFTWKRGSLFAFDLVE